MKKQRGKKAKYLIRSEKGLLNDDVRRRKLDDYPTSLLCSIRQKLRKKVSGITESFNTNSRYFGYWTGEDKDRAYIYVQKKKLRIDLCINRKFKKELQKAGFKVKYVNNYQGRAGWLTGWKVPYSTKNVNLITKWICKAFKENL